MHLLIECARARLDHAAVRRAAGTVEDWDALLARAAAHGMVPLLYWGLKQACPEVVPAPVLDELRRRFYVSAHRNLAFSEVLLSLASQFESAGIEFIPFKGPALAWSLYESPALRTMSDLDLLVRPAQLPHALDLLVSSGYRPSANADLSFFRGNHELALSSPATGLTIDLHWALAPPWLLHALDPEPFWTRLVCVPVAGGLVRTFAPADLLIFLCVHGAKHSWYPLAWLADLVRLIDRSRFDWDAIAARARSSHSSRILLASLLLAVDVLGASVPSGIVADARANPRASAIASRSHDRLLAASPAPPTPRALLYGQFDLLERPADKFQFCLSCSHPTTGDLDAFRLPASLFLAYYALRPLRLIKDAALAARSVRCRAASNPGTGS